MRVAILAPPGVQTLDVVGPAEIFWEAARRLNDMSAYDIQIISTETNTVAGTGQLQLLADRTIYDADEPIDTLLIAGDPSFQKISPDVIGWLQRRVPTVRRYGSVCTGVFILAAAGLLDGKRVTTHWECVEELRKNYPRIKLDEDAIFLRDGPLITAAGVTAGIDLALALVEEDYGHEIAMIVARYMVVFLRRSGGQSQFSAHLIGQMSQDNAIQKVQEYILENLDTHLTIEKLAHMSGMSPRNFARVFRRELNTTPGEFIMKARIDAARRLLESTDMPMQRIAVKCGFATADSMRRVFNKLLGVPPGQYRQQFQTVPKCIRVISDVSTYQFD
ncbi:GlxA family transcriptional regulator [Roseovarius sp. CAU 1744]|uniref:GlxA family transcriptional regulator n=1 Tax=Roseovarius sp. CAU 1744 TaxID=3140368 RepID=UPI00325B8A7D